MRKRMMVAVLVMAAVLTAIGSLKFFEVRAAIAKFSSFQMPPTPPPINSFKLSLSASTRILSLLPRRSRSRIRRAWASRSRTPRDWATESASV